MASCPDNFLGLETALSDYRTARYAVLPVPYDAAASFRAGAREGPRAILTASQHVELYDPQLGGEFAAAGVATLEPLEPNAAGPEEMHADIARAARRVHADGKFLLGLGGDHSITPGLVQGARSRHRHLSVLQIDAHADLRARYQGCRFSHACAMRRVHDLQVPFSAVGIRDCSAEEARFMKRNRITPVTAGDCRAGGNWIERALAPLSASVYVTVDIDGFDPSCAPGTGTPEPGGLDWYDVVELLHALTARRRVVGADIVEVMPLPGQVVTEFLAAKLAYKLISLIEFHA